MVLRFSPPIALSDACSTARASCAWAVAAMNTNAATSITSLFTISASRTSGPAEQDTTGVAGSIIPRHPEDDDEQVGLAGNALGACRVLVTAGARIELSGAVLGGPARRSCRKRAPRRIQRHAGAPGTSGDGEVRPRQWQLGLRRPHAKRSQRSAGVRR